MKKIFSIITLFVMIFTLQTGVFAANDDITVTIDGSVVSFDQPPVIIDGRTLVPMRFIFQKLGATVEWDGETSTATGTLDGIVVKIQNQNNVMTKNGAEIELDVPAQIINSRTLVPVRAISEAFGCLVDWNNDTRTVIIATQKEYSSETLKRVYNATMLLGNKTYSENDTFTYGELANAAVTIVMNEKETTYAGLGTQTPFTHTYARDFYYICENVLGFEFMSEENIDKNATLADTAEVLSFAVKTHDANGATFTPENLLTGKDGTKDATMKEFSEFVARLDDVAPILVKIVISKDGITRNVQTKIKKSENSSAYPANASDYRVILEGVASSIYEKELYNGDSENKPYECYDFVRDYRDIFIGIIYPWINKAADLGMEVEFEYYPSMCVNNNNGYTMRIFCNVISNGTKQLTASDIFTNTPGSKTVLKVGSTYVIDICNNGIVDSVEMPSDNVTMKRILTLGGE